MTAAQVNFFLNKEVNLVITTKPAFNVIIFACFEAIISINWIAIAYSTHIHFSHNKVRGFNRMRESEVSFFSISLFKKGLGFFCLFFTGKASTVLSLCLFELIIKGETFSPCDDQFLVPVPFMIETWNNLLQL